MKFNNLVNPKNLKNTAKSLLERQDLIIWGMTAIVPLVRMVVDNKEEKKHFKRDCTTFMGGTLAYFTGVGASNQVLKMKRFKNINPKAKKSISTFAGALTWLGLVTYGTVKLAEKLNFLKDEAPAQESPVKNNQGKLGNNLDIKEGLLSNMTPISKQKTTFEFHTPTTSNPFYRYNFSKYSQRVVNKPMGIS